MNTNIEQVALLREAAKGCHPKYSNGLRVLADSLEAQSKAEPNLQPKDMSQAKRFISQLEGEVERLKVEVERMKVVHKETKDRWNEIMTSLAKENHELETQLSAIRQAVENALIVSTTSKTEKHSGLWKTFVELHAEDWQAILDAINPAPVLDAKSQEARRMLDVAKIAPVQEGKNEA